MKATARTTVPLLLCVVGAALAPGGRRSALAFSGPLPALRSSSSSSGGGRGPSSFAYRGAAPSALHVASSPHASQSSSPSESDRNGARRNSKDDEEEEGGGEAAIESPVEVERQLGPVKKKTKKGGISRKMELSCCNRDSCSTELREVVVGAHNSIVFTGPATGQVVYGWTDDAYATTAKGGTSDVEAEAPIAAPPTVLLLIKRDDDELMRVAAEAIRTLSANSGERGLNILLDAEQAAKLRHNHGVDDENISLFDAALLPDRPVLSHHAYGGGIDDDGSGDDDVGIPDLVVTLGGDGLLMYASSLFPGPCPPILCVAGGSLGFLTPFARDEMVVAIESALGLREGTDFIDGTCKGIATPGVNAAPDIYTGVLGSDDDKIESGGASSGSSATDLIVWDDDDETDDLDLVISDDDLDLKPQVCLSMRMRLEVTIVDPDGVARDEFCVLNEVTVDRGSSPYLANLECFCDGTHLTTIQADGVIFATPTGSTAYSMAAGGSVIHPAVPAILVTPICPHVLSFRPMVLPDHVVLRCFVPDDARSPACVSFDGKERVKLRKGESIQICMSNYPVPTINRVDHSSDWLGSLKRNFNFNTRVRQNPL